jgi:hypothetical protein
MADIHNFHCPGYRDVSGERMREQAEVIGGSEQNGNSGRTRTRHTGHNDNPANGNTCSGRSGHPAHGHRRFLVPG